MKIKTKAKRFYCAIITMTMLISLMPIINVSAASTTIITQNEAIAWLNSVTGTKVSNPYGGYTGECASLGAQYYVKLLGYVVSANEGGTGNGRAFSDYNHSTALGWSKGRIYDSTQLSPGDVICWGANEGGNSAYGHVAIYALGSASSANVYESSQRLTSGYTQLRNGKYLVGATYVHPVWKDEPIIETVAQPTKSVQSTAYGSKSVTLSCATTGAEIRYTTNGSEPSKTNGSLYSGAFSVSSACTVKAKAFKNGYNASSTMTSSIAIARLTAPEIKSSYTDNGAMITMSCTNGGAEIYYTTDGSQPSEKSKKYNGGFLVTDTTDFKAISMQKGCISSDVTNKSVKMTAPDAPQITLFDTQSKIAEGDAAKIKWNSVESASSYKVKVYKDGQSVRETEVKDNMMTYDLDKAGNYTITVSAHNFKGDSPESNSVAVEAVAPLDVVFEDWDGTILADSKVRYGYSVEAPENPTREGYDFKGWSVADLSCIRENTTITAQYNIKKFTVEFYDIDGKTKIGSSQRVEYQSAAVVPDESEVTQIKQNYKFNNWYVDPSSKCKDYTHVTSDMKIIAKQIWADEMKPISITINSAKLQEGNSYVADLSIDSTDQSLTNFKLIGVLKTSSGRTVKTTVLEENMKATAHKDMTYTINLIDHSDDGKATQNIATKMVIVAVGIEGESATGATLSELVSADIEPEWTDWSDWSETVYTASDSRMVKTKEESRVRNWEYTTSNTSNNIGNGWELYDTTSTVGNWSGWSQSKPGSKTGREIQTRDIPATYKTQYLYKGYTNGYNYHFCPLEGKQYCGGNFWYIDSGWLDYELPWAAWGYSQTCAHSGAVYWGKFTTWGSSPYYYDYDTRSVQTGGGYKEYRYRDTTYTYKFKKWSEWSEWSESEKTGNDIEKRTLYSYSDRLTNPSDYEEINEDRTEYNIKGNLPSADDVSMEGRLATVLVYKDRNTDPTEAQLEHVEQITLGVDGSYDFTFSPREEISEETGNYIVALSVEGDSRLTNVEYIEAPKPKYTVKFIANGDVVSEQTVEQGGDAVVPTAPQIEGYTFVKWDDRTSYITADWTLNAVYTKNTYTIAFADFANDTVTMQTYAFEDEIQPPATDSMKAEGREFKGWYVDVNGIKSYIDDSYTVAGSTVLYADWDYDEYTVKFVNEDGTKTISEQKVKYGECASLPNDPAVSENMRFVGWSTDAEWWNVKSDIIVYPLVVYETTTEAPSYRVYPSDNTHNAIVLESNTENASIYYTTDGSEPDFTTVGNEDSATKLYNTEQGISITEDTEIKAIAVAENANTSEQVSFNIAYEIFEIGESGEMTNVSGSNAKGKAGKQAQIVFDISGNPGISALKLSATYDSSVMKLAEVKNANLFENALFQSSPLANNPIVLTWASAENSTNDGKLVTLVFDINADAELGDYPVVFTAEANNADEESVGVIKTTGYVSVVENEYGDANGDGKVNLKDTMRILKFLSNWVVQIDESASDVNADGIVSLLDVTRLLKFLADWDVTLGAE